MDHGFRTVGSRSGVKSPKRFGGSSRRGPGCGVLVWPHPHSGTVLGIDPLHARVPTILWPEPVDVEPKVGSAAWVNRGGLLRNSLVRSLVRCRSSSSSPWTETERCDRCVRLGILTHTINDDGCEIIRMQQQQQQQHFTTTVFSTNAPNSFLARHS